MPKSRPPYPAAFRQQMVELVRSGRTPGELAREFEPSAEAIRNWVAQADRDAGKRSDGLRTEEHEEIRRLRRENRRLREEREILAKPRLVRAGDRDPGGLPVHEHEPGSFSRRHDGPPCSVSPRAGTTRGVDAPVGSRPGRCRADHPRAGDSRSQPGHVRRAADSRRPGRRRRVGRPQASRAGDARRGDRRREPASRPPHDAPGGTSPAGAGSGRAPLRGRRAEPPVGRRHHLRPTLAGFLYLAIVLDVFSRRVVGWAMAAHLRTELVIEALEMGIVQRRPEAVVHHSDQGGQYTSLAFGARCREWGVTPPRPPPERENGWNRWPPRATAVAPGAHESVRARIAGADSRRRQSCSGTSQGE